MLASASGELKTRSEPNSVLQARRQLENSAFALHFVRALFAAGVGHIFAIDDDARIAAHLVVQAGIDEVGHGARSAALGARRFTRTAIPAASHCFGGKRGAGRVKIFRVDVRGMLAISGKRRFKRTLRGFGGFVLGFFLQCVDLLGGQDAFAQQPHLHLRNRVAHGVCFALGCGAIELVIVG